MKNRIDWDFVNKKMEEDPDGGLAVARMYAYPDFINPLNSPYTPGMELQPKWDIPKEVAICAAITGAFHNKASNPHHPIEVEDIRREALDVCAAGAANVHVHVRDENGVNTLDLKRFHAVMDPIREQYPDVLVCGCVVPFVPGDWERMEQAFKEGLFDQTPVNTVASYCGDSLFFKSPHAMIKKAELCEKYDVKPQIAVYSDGDIDNARRYLVEPGLLSKPYYWILLPGLLGCSPMYSPLDMFDLLSGYVRRIREIDADSKIMVVAGGRASSHITTAAMMLGLDVRVGKEDSIWQYPHKDDLIESNVETYKNTVAIARLLGREPATPAEYIKKFGLRRQGGKVLGK